MTRWQALPPGPRGALVLGVLAVALVALARVSGAQQGVNLLFALATVLAAIGLGFLLGTAPTALWRPPMRALALATAAGLAGLALYLAWGQVSGQFAAREWQWLAVLAAGLGVVPAVLPAALVRRPGALTVGLTLQGLATAAASTLYAPAALLFVPLLALPVELWLLFRRQEGGASTWAVAGALTMAVAVLASRLELWTLSGLWPLAGALASAAVAGALFGAMTHYVAAALRPRLGLVEPDAGEPPEGWE
jgi:hypothetical protein